ncbi:MAG TPA: hypothetical protein VIU44_10370 [Gaiellaceae bacterium]
MGRVFALVAALAAAALLPASAVAADSWLPHPADATWTWEWTDTAYNPTPTKEKVTVKEQKGAAFTLEWTTKDVGNPDGTADSLGLVAFQETSAGLVNTDWQSTPPPTNFPILCQQLAKCGNSVASVLYQLIWGTRAPLLAEPLLNGTTWSSSGGANGDVSSISQYMGREQVTVPAFPNGVMAAKVRTDITQAGAIGDPYGSGVRTTWWVYGVGPVKIVFEHAGGVNAPVTTAQLDSTNQTAADLPPDADYFPLTQGLKHRYRWTNTKWLKKPSVQEMVVSQAVNASARADFKHISGPIRLAGTYIFALRADGITCTAAQTKSASLATFPKLGPSFLPANRRRHFATPYDLLVYGTNPILPAYPQAGQSWEAKSSGRDFQVFGVTGTTKVVGLRKVTVPAGTFTALVVQSTLSQAGFPFGSGTRTAYFVDGKGLVKLVFRHGDHSTSTVELLK